MSDKKPPVKLEVNIPLWLELIEHERFGFDPYSNETPEKTVKGKKIPASKYWMFNVVNPETGEESVWFCYREKTADLITRLANEQKEAGEPTRVALLEFTEGTKHFLAMFAPHAGYTVMPDHEIPARFKEFCGAKTPAAGIPKPPAKPAISAQAATNGSGKLDWVNAEEQLKKALSVSRKAWLAVLNESFTELQKAEVDGDQVEMTKAMECHRILKEAAVAGISTSAHTMWIDVVAGRGRK